MPEAMREPGLHIFGEVALGFPPPQRTYARVAYANTEPDVEKARWLTVRADGTVVAYAGKVEYGQGIRTGLAIEVADELRVPLSSVEVVLGDTALVPWDMGTFGSQSTARVGLQLRKAAATAREALLEMGADRLDLPSSDLRAESGSVASAADGTRRLTYAELIAGDVIVRDLTDDVPLTARRDFTVMGESLTRIDAEARVTGRAIYSQDVRLDGMLFAAVLRRPSRGAELRSVDLTAAQRMPGVAHVVREEDLVAVLADSDEHAATAVRVIQAEWGDPRDRSATLDLPEILLNSASDPFVTQEAGSLDEGFRAADTIVERDYFIPYVSNAPMEPRAAVASWEGDRLTVWAGTQRPFGIRQELAQRFGIDEPLVRVIAPEIGGGFGSKSPYPVAHEAARLARIAGVPVRVAYTRAEDMIYATMRPAALIRIKSGVRKDGAITAWECHAYHAGDRPFLGRRGSDSPYTHPHVKVTTYTSASPLATGSYRSLGAAANHFAREVHVDEIAEAVGQDPVEFRLRNLSHPRFRRVLERAAEAHGWQSASGASRRGQGIAIGIDVGSYIATAVQLDVGGREVRVERVKAVLDCGLVVNPEGAKNQVEGAVVMGLGTALYESIDFQDGRVLNAGFTRYRVPRSNDAPRIDTVLVGDDDTPSTGAGEPGIVPIAAAISNAVFDRTGQRHRELPIQRYLG
jgi:isoquinoline 1-oxidoreductase